MPRLLDHLLARIRRKAMPIHRQRVWQRPRLESLEARTNPASLNFAPFSVDAVNPSPLPATALIQFNPVPDLTAIPTAGGMFQTPLQISGNFQQTLTPSNSSATATGSPVNAFPGHLIVTYNLKGSATGTVTPADATAGQPGLFSASFTFGGKVTETFIPWATGTMPQSVWIISTTLTEMGTVSEPVLPPRTNAASTTATFTENVTLSQTELHALTSATPASSYPWSIHSTIQTAGTLKVSRFLPPSAGGAVILPPTSFNLQDQIGESLTQVTPTATPAQPPVTISAVDNASGTVTDFALPVSAVPTSSGSTTYHQDLSETITTPPGPTNPGSTQTVTQALVTTGTFLSPGIELVIGTAPDSTTIGLSGDPVITTTRGSPTVLG